MVNSLIILVFLAQVVAPPVVSSTPDSSVFLQPEIIPVQWTKTTCGTQVMGCYTFDQVKLLKDFDLTLKLKLVECDVCQKNLEDWQKISKDQEKLLELAAEREVDWKGLADVRNKELARVRADRDNLASTPTAWELLPWGITIVVLVAVSAFVGGYFVGR
jgi:hypothetical protein